MTDWVTPNEPISSSSLSSTFVYSYCYKNVFSGQIRVRVILKTTYHCCILGNKKNYIGRICVNDIVLNINLKNSFTVSIHSYFSCYIFLIGDLVKSLFFCPDAWFSWTRSSQTQGIIWLGRIIFGKISNLKILSFSFSDVLHEIWTTLYYPPKHIPNLEPPDNH